VWPSDSHGSAFPGDCCLVEVLRLGQSGPGDPALRKEARLRASGVISVMAGGPSAAQRVDEAGCIVITTRLAAWFHATSMWALAFSRSWSSMEARGSGT
jgi:hypothetical protein